MSDWIQVDILTNTEGIEPVASILLNMGLGYAVQDSNDFDAFLEGKNGHWDYIDEEVMKLKDAPTIVTAYLPNKKQGVDQLAVITRELDRLKKWSYDGEWGELTYTLEGLKEEDWATAWKQYFHPVKITDRIVICPTWEDYDRAGDEIVISLDPGMAFGTGTHETTKLCLETLDDIIKGGENVLDIGSGSGILSIASVMLGAKDSLGVDIDQVAMETGVKNAEQNNVSDKSKFIQGNFVDKVSGEYDIIFANIVADAIIGISKDVNTLLKQDGYYITSGIIDERSDEVESAINEAGFSVKEKREDNGWVAFVATK